jgi:hypothetical protein
MFLAGERVPLRCSRCREGPGRIDNRAAPHGRNRDRVPRQARR